MRQIINIVEYHIFLISFTFCQILQSINWQDSPGAKGLKWRFFDHESEQAEFGLKL